MDKPITIVPFDKLGDNYLTQNEGSNWTATMHSIMWIIAAKDCAKGISFHGGAAQIILFNTIT